MQRRTRCVRLFLHGVMQTAVNEDVEGDGTRAVRETPGVWNRLGYPEIG